MNKKLAGYWYNGIADKTQKEYIKLYKKMGRMIRSYGVMDNIGSYERKHRKLIKVGYNEPDVVSKKRYNNE